MSDIQDSFNQNHGLRNTMGIQGKFKMATGSVLLLTLALLTLGGLAQDESLPVPELEKLQKEYASLVTKTEGPHLAALDKQYVARLERKQATAQQAGNLDEALAMEAEKKAISLGNAVPVDDETKTPAVLRQMHATYRAEISKLKTAQAKPSKLLRDDYAKELDDLVIQLTKEGKLKEALTVRKFRQNLPASSNGDSVFLIDKQLRTQFVRIPAGSFQMGNAMAEDKDITDAPIHTVTLSVFYMAKNSVTKADWDAVRTWGLTHGYTDLAAGAGKAANHPVQTVNWYDVVKWCNARSEMEGLTPCYTLNTVIYRTTNNDAVVCNWAASGYRLPSEAEWEKAARGGLSGKRFPWGDTISHANANFNNTGKEPYLKGTADLHSAYKRGESPYTSQVGSFPANGYGLYDMAGNIWQWCWDWTGTYAAGEQTDPRGALSGSIRVLRGGIWGNNAGGCRAAVRNGVNPTYGNYNIGFRIARSSVP